MSFTDLLQPYQLYVIAFSLIVTRIGGFILASPFPGNYVPDRQRVGLMLVLAFFVTFAVAPTPTHLALDGKIPLILAGEFGVGVLAGAAYRFTLAAADVVADMVSHSTSLATPSVLNPLLGTPDTPLAAMLGIFTILLILEAGIHRAVLGYLMESFRAVPVGTDFTLSATLPLFMELATQSMVVGVRLALPVIAINLVLQVALALVARAAPSLQIFSIGFAAMLITGLFTFAAVLPDIGFGLVERLHALPTFLERLFTEVAG